MNLEQLASYILPGSFGYIIVFFAALLEALPFGAFLPGQTIVMLAGFVAHQGSLRLYDVIIAATIGAIIGDTISYYMGRKYGISFLRRYGKYFFFKEEYFKKTKPLMRDHVGKTLILSRFVSVTRAFSPFIAGMHKVKLRTFFLFNVIGGILWAISFAVLGFLFGASYAFIAKYSGIFSAAGILVGILLYYLYWYLAVKKKLLTKPELTLAIIAVTSLVFFSIILDDVHDGGFGVHLDAPVNAFMNGIHSNWLTFIARGLDVGFGPIMMTLLVGLIVGVFWLVDRRKDAIFFGTVMLIQGITVLIVKYIIERLRPENGMITEQSYSFPSGHTITAVVLFGLLIYLLWHDLETLTKRITAAVMFSAVAILVGLSRLYLNVHWLSDVLGAITLGIFILGTSILLRRLVLVEKQRIAEKKTVNQAVKKAVKPVLKTTVKKK